MTEATIDDNTLALERTAIKHIAEAYQEILRQKQVYVYAAERSGLNSIPPELYDLERIPIEFIAEFKLPGGSYNYYGFCKPLIQDALEKQIDSTEERFRYLNYCRVEFENYIVYKPESGIAFGSSLLCASNYYQTLMNLLYADNYQGHKALKKSAYSAAFFLRWLDEQIMKYKKIVEIDKRVLFTNTKFAHGQSTPTDTTSDSSHETNRPAQATPEKAWDILPKIENWKELCLGNTSNLSIYIAKEGNKGRDYSFVELHLGDKRRNAANHPLKIWHAVRFYAFGEGKIKDFDKTDLLRANKALINLFQMPPSAGKPFPIYKSGITVNKNDALKRQTIRYNDDFSGKSETECAEEARNMDDSIGYDEKEEKNID